MQSHFKTTARFHLQPVLLDLFNSFALLIPLEVGDNDRSPMVDHAPCYVGAAKNQSPEGWVLCPWYIRGP